MRKEASNPNIVPGGTDKNQPAGTVICRNNDPVWLASIVQQSANAIISIDINGRILSWNSSAEELFCSLPEELKGKDIRTILDENAEENLAQIISGKVVHAVEFWFRTKGGEVLAISVTSSPIYDASSTFAGSALVMRDVTVIKAKHEQLIQTKANLTAIFDNAQEGFVLIDTDGTIREFNSIAQSSILLTHSSRKAIPGHSIFEHIEPSRRDFFRSIMNRVIAGETIQYDKAYPTSTKTFWFTLSLNAVKEGEKVTGITITGIDITTRKIAEKVVEQKEKFFRTIVENSGDAVTIFSSDAKQLYVSSSIKNILGYSEEESLEVSIFSLIHPDDVEGAAKIWEATFANPGKSIRGHIIRILHKDGTYRWMENTVTNLVDDPIIGGIVSNFKDISDKIESEKQLRDSQERYKHLFYNNPLPMWIFDPETYYFLEVNDASIVKYGYSREEFLQMTIKDIRPDDAVERLIASMNGRMEKNYNYSGTWEHKAKNGDILDVEISSHPLELDGRQAILVLANDITERKKATRLLLKVYQEKSSILESIKDGFFTVNHDWEVTYFNKQAEIILGMPREQIIGKNIWEVYKEAIPLKFHSEGMKAMKERIPVTFEEFFHPLNLWVDASIYPSDEGLSIYFKDISEKKSVEEKVKTAKERYEIVARASNQAVYEWDIVNGSNYWNEGLNTIFGHERAEGPMSTDTWTENLHPDEKDELFRAVHDAFKDQTSSLTREMRFRCADGSYKTVLDHLVIFYDNNGQPLKMMGAMKDITDRKKHEEAVGELNEQLNKRAKELAISNEELERFAYVASHDLQEPLRMVSSFLQLLQKKYESQLDKTALQYIDFAVDGAERMKRLILDLLEYSRVGTNKDVLVSTDMNEVVNHVLKNFNNRIMESEAIIKVNELPVIQANKSQMTQLLQNLISNAMKYNTSFVPEVEIGCNDRGSSWEFYVKDNGIGVDQKFFEKIFIIFQRLHNRNQFSGTGIGLAICKKIVDRHAGQIWLESTIGQGSTFRFTIKK